MADGENTQTQTLAPERPSEQRPTLIDRLDDDRTMIVVFATVTVVIGLLGIAVSGLFEPLTHPAIEARVVTEEATTATAASVGPSADTPTTAPAESTPSTAPDVVAPGVVEVSGDGIDFGADGKAAEIEMTNSGGEPVDWSASSSSDAIAFSANRGTLRPGETVNLRVALDRSLVAEGEISETIKITWPGGEKEVAAVGIHDDLPVIHNPKASPAAVVVDAGGSCSPTKTTVSARIRDTSSVESAVVKWTDGSASHETPMTATGDDIYQAVIGPFTTQGAASARVVAFDDRGNAGGAAISITVDACP